MPNRIERPSLRLATEGGKRVQRAARLTKTWSDEEAEDWFIEMLGEFVPHLDPTGGLRVIIVGLSAEFERRRARRRRV